METCKRRKRPPCSCVAAQSRILQPAWCSLQGSRGGEFLAPMCNIMPFQQMS